MEGYLHLSEPALDEHVYLPAAGHGEVGSAAGATAFVTAVEDDVRVTQIGSPGLVEAQPGGLHFYWATAVVVNDGD